MSDAVVQQYRDKFETAVNLLAMTRPIVGGTLVGAMRAARKAESAGKTLLTAPP
jgi:hypothetical protein